MWFKRFFLLTFLKYMWLLCLLSGIEAEAQFVFEYRQDFPLIQENESLSQPWAGGLNAGQYYNMDINLDGQQDLLVFDRTSQQFNPFLFLDGAFRFAPQYIPLFPATAEDFVIMADYDGDGRKDLFTSSGRRGITVFRNVSDGFLKWELVADPIRARGFNDFTIAIQVNATDIPAISDIDSDGDLDIITYNVNGRGYLEYYQNMSIENRGDANELDFEARDRQWGDLQECDCNIFAFGDESCAELSGRSQQARLAHVGAKTLLAIDIDNDGDKDIFTSDEGCGVLYYLENTGSAQNARFEGFTTTFLPPASGSVPITFPAAYRVDATGDGIDDLVVASNAGENSFGATDMTASSWLYENTGTQQAPAFGFRQVDFLQQQMLDVGENAAPALADYDADGDPDLFIGQRGRFADDDYLAGVVLYENTGSANEPVFEFRANDYLQLSQWGLQQLKVYFADLNRDGMPDMLLSGSRNPFVFRAELFYLENLAQAGEPWQFDPEQRQLLDFDLDYFDHLSFVDADEDGDQDLLVARQIGDLEYYENYADAGLPDWRIAFETAGGIAANVLRRGLSIVLHDIDNDGRQDLVSTDDSGVLSVRTDFLNQLGNETLADTVSLFSAGRERNMYLGNGAYLAATDLNSSGTLFLAGSPQGGIRLFSFDPQSERTSPEVLVYPNPAGFSTDIVSIFATQSINALQLIDFRGALVAEYQPPRQSPSFELDTAPLASGIYLLRIIEADGGIRTTKLIVK
jgi:hypothetical protein